MAFGGRELRLILSVQSYGTGNIQRLRRDIMALQSATNFANKQQLLQTRIARQQVRVTTAERDLQALRQGVPYLAARNKAVNQLATAHSRVYQTQARQLGNERALFDLETKRMQLEGKLPKARVDYGSQSRQVRILERQLQSLTMQETVLTTSGKGLNTALSVQQSEVARLDAVYKDLIKTKGVDVEATKAAEAELAHATATLAMYRDELANVNRAEKMAALQRREIRARRIAHVGRTAQFAGLIGMAGLTVAASSAARFNEQLVLAATQARDVNAPLAQVVVRTKQLQDGFRDTAGVMHDGILKLMQQFPATADDMAKASYDIYSSMRISFGGGLDLLKEFNKLAVATGSDLTTATNAGITVLNNFGGTSKNVDKTLNLMVTTIRFGRMRLEDFNQMLNKVAPAAVAAGQSFKDVAGAMALLTTRQPSQRQSATGIARLLQTFRDPDFQKGAMRFGVNITTAANGVGKLKPLPKIIDEMNKGFGLFIKGGGANQLFKELTATGHESGVGRQSRIEAANAYVLLIKNIKDYRALQGAVTGDTNEFSRALEAMSASPGVKWQIFINQMKAFVITVGEAALPVLLKFAGWLSAAAKFFEGLNSGLRESIVRVGVWTAALLLVGGTIVNIAGSVAALGANMKIMRGEMVLTADAAQAATIKTSLLSTTLRGIAGLGIIAVPIVVQLLKGGDPSLWTFLGASAQGAVGGAMIAGLPGAIAGAIAAPVAVKLVADRQQNNRTKAAMRVFAKKAGIDVGKDFTFGDAITIQKWMKAHPKFVADYLKKDAAKSKDPVESYKKLLKGFNEDTLKQIQDEQTALQKAFAEQNAGSSEQARRAAQLAKAHVQALKTALENEQQVIKSAVSNLAGVYNNFRQLNEQGMGQVFGGPTMQGILGQVFGDINDQLRQFGIQIPVPFKILQQDMDQQLAYFKRWRTGLDRLLKRGAPLELVQQIQQLGPSAIPMIEGLLGASPKQLKHYFGNFKSSQKLINDASQKDMKRQLNAWEKHGKDIAYKMVAGLNDGLAANQVYLQKQFKKYIVDTFGTILKKNMATEVSKAMADAVAQANAAAGITTGTGTGGTGGGGGGRGRGRGRGVHPSLRAANAVIQMNADRRAIARDQARIRRLARGGFTADEKATAVALTLDIGRHRFRLEQERKRELASIRRQMRGHHDPRGPHPFVPYTVTYMGDTVTVKADGATPASVMKALNKHKFRQRARKKHKK